MTCFIIMKCLLNDIEARIDIWNGSYLRDA